MTRTVAALTIATGALWAGVPASAQMQDVSKVEIKAEALAPGVAVLFGAGGNIGVSHGPDGTVLIDDQFAPLTDKITAAVAKLGGSPVKYLVNTHWHFDHTGGNENLGKAGATIYAHDNVRVRMVQGGKILGMDFAPAAKAALPVVTYAGGITFHLNGDEIDAVFTGGGHTDGDSVLYWRKANVLHTGDLMMNRQGFPFIDIGSGGNAVRLVASLDRILAMTNAQTRIIPGHGPVATRADLQAWRDMIAGAVETVRKARDEKKTLVEFLAANPLTAPSTGFVTAEGFARAIWASLDAPVHDKHHNHDQHHAH